MHIYSIFVGINTQIHNYHDRTGTVPMWFDYLHSAGCGTPMNLSYNIFFKHQDLFKNISVLEELSKFFDIWCHG